MSTKNCHRDVKKLQFLSSVHWRSCVIRLLVTLQIYKKQKKLRMKTTRLQEHQRVHRIVTIVTDENDSGDVFSGWRLRMRLSRNQVLRTVNCAGHWSRTGWLDRVSVTREIIETSKKSCKVHIYTTGPKIVIFHTFPIIAPNPRTMLFNTYRDMDGGIS